MALYLGSTKLSERFYLDIRSNPLPESEFIAYLNNTLTTFNAPYSIACLRESCFEGRTALQNVKLSPSIKELKANCFKGCTGLKKVWLPCTCINVAATSFSGVPSTCKIYTDSLMAAPKWLSGWNGSATVVYGSSETAYNNA
jgi:hypothetical protein